MALPDRNHLQLNVFAMNGVPYDFVQERSYKLGKKYWKLIIDENKMNN